MEEGNNSKKEENTADIPWFKSLVVIVLLGLLSIWAFGSAKGTQSFDISYEKAIFIIKDASVSVKIAKTPYQLTKGLSDTPSLEEGEGMFFIFGESYEWAIWMKDMNFPIDVIWFDQYMKVVDYKERLSPESYPESFKPKKKSIFVLEVPAGFVEKYNISDGDQGFLQ